MRTIEEDDIECRCTETDKKCKEKGREGTGQEKVVKTGKQREREKKKSFLFNILSIYLYANARICMFMAHPYIHIFICMYICVYVGE